MNTILIVDDDKDTQFILSSILKNERYKTIIAGDGNRALKEVKKRALNLVLLDIKLPGMDGMKVLEEMKKIDKDLIIIMLTAYGDVKGAVKAMKLGAFDYITKPFYNEELVLIIKKALQSQHLSKEVESLRKKLGEKTGIENIIGENLKIKQILNQIKVVAPTNMTVILQGESGTGKEIVARIIHKQSLRKDKPFIAIDCGTIPETLVESELFGYDKGAFTGADAKKEGEFEKANGGTILLDEITNLPKAAQAKLLRVIQEKKLQHLGGRRHIKIDVRIIVATNIKLSEAVRQGKFRADLFHRLNEFQLDLPPLRERKDDIPILAEYFLNEANKELTKKIKGFSAEAMKSLLNYQWSGNVRELKNLVRRAVLLAESNYVTPAQLLLNNTSPAKRLNFEQDLEKGISLREAVKKVTKQTEEEMIKQALAKAGGNKTKAAKTLKIDRMTLYSKIKEFQLE